MIIQETEDHLRKKYGDPDIDELPYNLSSMRR
jgi:hypothetical protein